MNLRPHPEGPSHLSLKTLEFNTSTGLLERRIWYSWPAKKSIKVDPSYKIVTFYPFNPDTLPQYVVKI